MWGESSKSCENNCQCSGLITDSFRINSGNNATKRKQDNAYQHNFKLKMNPNALDFSHLSPTSPSATPSKRRVLGEIQNSPLYLPKVSPVIERLRETSKIDKSPQIDRNSLSPLTSRSFVKRSTKKITKIFEERSKFKMANKENIENCFISETFMKFDIEEDARDCSFSKTMVGEEDWSTTKLDFANALPSKALSPKPFPPKQDLYVPDEIPDHLDSDLEALHDLEEEFNTETFEQCTKYEIISTDSPDIISRGRQSTARKVNARNFVFGSELTDSECSTSFNRPNPTATRMLNFEDDAFEFTSPAARKPSFSVKKSLKFSDTPTKNPLRHEKSDSSIGSMSLSPASSRCRIFTSDSTTSMESGFMSEMEEPFLDFEEHSNSPKVANFSDLLNQPIKNDILFKEDSKRPMFHRSMSFNPEAKARVSLLSILESPDVKKTTKRLGDEVVLSKRKRVCEEEVEVRKRPVLQRAFSENNASIMSAMARSATEPDLIGDFSQPFALPLTCGNHVDLKSITCETLASLIQGEYEDSIGEFKVIDCRYPYEFTGGHIRGAVNLHTPAHVLELVDQPRVRRDDGRRSILVFHCEFSLERGPKLTRFLRSSDRAKNKEHYPSLHYPEVYLLHEGYRAFYRRYPQLCTPEGYTAMLDPKHKECLRRHRSVPGSVSGRRNRLLM